MRLTTLVTCSISVLAISFTPATANQPDTDKIIVQSSRLNQSITDLGASAAVINAADMDQLGFGLALDALAHIPGVTVTQNGAFGGVASVRIRGAASGQTLVLIDGIPVNDPSAPAGGFNFAHLDTDMIEQIEVLKGPQSTLWGTDAIGGVVSIITKSLHDKKTHRVFGEYGAFGTMRGGGSIMHTNKKGSVLLSAVGTSSRGISKADEKNGNKEKDPYNAMTLAAKGNLDIGHGLTLNTNILWTNSNTAFDSFVFGAQGNIADGDENSVHESISANIALTNIAFDARLENLFLVGYTDTKRDNFVADALNFSSQGERHILRYQGRVRVMEKDTLVFGIEREETSSSNSDTYTNSFFVLYEYNPNSAITLTSGVRMDKHADFGQETTGRIAIALRPTDQIMLHASAGQGFKAPTLFQRDYFCCNADGPSPTLGAENSQGFDAAIAWHSKNKQISTILTYFNMYTQNQIDFSHALGGYENIAEVRVEGVEISTRHQITNWFGVTTDYTYVETKDVAGKRLAQIPTHSGDLAFSITPASPFSGAILLRFNGNKKNIDGSTLKSWYRIDANVRYKLGPQFETYMRVENILGEDYQEIVGYGTPEYATSIGMKAKF